MKVLVVGCGYVGARAADLLHAEGHEVTGLTHTEDSARRLAAVKPYAVRAADVADATSLRALATEPATVIHCASSNRGGAEMYRKVYLDGCRNLAAAFPDARLLFCSSTSVYPQADGSWITEADDATPERETSRVLRAAEDLVLQRGGCVARLAGIYGPGRSFLLKNFLEGTAAIEGNEGEGRWLNQIHREDAAAALLHLAEGARAGVFNVADNQPLTQRKCYERLAARFQRPLPPATPPNTGRKRAWTSKRISNAKLRATGWTPQFPDYLAALEHDADLVPSILAQVAGAVHTDPMGEKTPGATNIVLIGLMGSGKTTVGRIAAHILGFDFVDTDHLIVTGAGKSIPEIFATEGEEGFRRRETAALKSLAGRTRFVIATGGGIVTRPENLPVLRQLGFVVWLNAEIETLRRRTAHSHDRPLLQGVDPLVKLHALHETRAPLYQGVCDLKISTDELSLDDAAYGLAESARVHFNSRA
jgi:shikimate kinase/nucleoside-diphosphate-sugar epimerase